MAHKLLLLLAAVATLAAVRAQIPNVGWCPEYLPMTDFDMNRFLGKWYEAERYFTFTEVVSRCVVTDYAKAPSGRIYVSNEVTNRLTGVKRIINGNMELLGKGDEGRIHVKYATTPIPTETTLTVLETDYDNYAVVWSCNGFGPIHTQNAWLMTRERLPSGNVLQKGYGILDKFKISRTFFVKTDQEGCYLAASDINAANGITAQSTVPEYSGSDQREEGEGLRTAGVEKPEAEKENEIKPAEILKPETTEIKPETLEIKPATLEIKPATLEIKPTTLEIKPAEHVRPAKPLAAPLEIKEEKKPEPEVVKPEEPKIEEVKKEEEKEKVPVVSVPDHILSVAAPQA